jgi:hypothetical protein
MTYDSFCTFYLIIKWASSQVEDVKINKRVNSCAFSTRNAIRQRSQDMGHECLCPICIEMGMCQKRAILLDSVDLVQVQNCQVDLTHARKETISLGS